MKVLITGAAGLVGQNLVNLLSRSSDMIVHAIDKDIYNLDVLKQINKSIRTDLCDLADRSNYQILDSDYDCVVINHAQISSKQDAQFERNNVIATTNLISHLKETKSQV